MEVTSDELYLLREGKRLEIPKELASRFLNYALFKEKSGDGLVGILDTTVLLVHAYHREPRYFKRLMESVERCQVCDRYFLCPTHYIAFCAIAGPLESHDFPNFRLIKPLAVRDVPPLILAQNEKGEFWLCMSAPEVENVLLEFFAEKGLLKPLRYPGEYIVPGDLLYLLDYNYEIHHVRWESTESCTCGLSSAIAFAVSYSMFSAWNWWSMGNA